MKCQQCGSENVSVQLVQTGATSKTKDKGCLFAVGRLCLIVFTLGLWLIFGKKKAKTKTTFTNKKVAICQSCGAQWDA